MAKLLSCSFQSGKIKFSTTVILKIFQRDFVGIELRTLASNNIIKVPNKMSWFLIFYKYHRVFVGHTSKIPVKLVNIFFTQPTLHPSSNNGISQTNKDQIFEFECSTQSSPAPCTSIDTLVALSNNNLNIYTNESWGY